MSLCCNMWLFCILHLSSCIILGCLSSTGYISFFSCNFKIVSLETAGFLYIQLAHGISKEELLRQFMGVSLHGGTPKTRWAQVPLEAQVVVRGEHRTRD